MAENKVPKSIQVIDIDAYSPPLIASRIDKVATVKAKLSFCTDFFTGNISRGLYCHWRTIRHLCNERLQPALRT